MTTARKSKEQIERPASRPSGRSDGAWTPGPWVVEDADRVVRGPDGRTIARGHLRGTRLAVAEARANARLIAAAPDLYEAAHALIATFDARREATSAGVLRGVGEASGALKTDAELRAEGMAAVKALRAALARARGES